MKKPETIFRDLPESRGLEPSGGIEEGARTEVLGKQREVRRQRKQQWRGWIPQGKTKQQLP